MHDVVLRKQAHSHSYSFTIAQTCWENVPDEPVLYTWCWLTPLPLRMPRQKS